MSDVSNENDVEDNKEEINEKEQPEMKRKKTDL